MSEKLTVEEWTRKYGNATLTLFPNEQAAKDFVAVSYKPQKWVNDCYPADNTWCWVSDGIRIWLAMYDPSAANSWTNTDTWEDFGNDVRYWIPLETPHL